MSLTQQMMDEAARFIHGEIQTETVTYRHRPTQNATVQTYTLTDGHLSQYSLNEFSRDTTILSTDRNFRLPQASWPASARPSRWDEFDDSDGVTWRVVNARYGPGYPFYHIQCRQVG